MGTVRTYISRLRRCLDQVSGDRAVELLKTAGDGYAIETSGVTVDIEQFTRQVQQAQLTRQDGDFSQAASQLAQSLELWQGMPLAGIPGPYADAQRARLLELHLAVTEDRLSMDIESGGHLAAIAELLTLVATDEDLAGADTAGTVGTVGPARAAFPGGQLYAELGNPDGSPVDSSAVLARWRGTLGEAGLPERDPAARRVLAVLDGVRDTAQARLLLGGLRGCTVIVITQRRMIDLPGARWFEVDPLPPAEAMCLLERLIGRERVAADRAGAEWVAELCAGQPIALRTAAARLVIRPAWKISAMARQLAEELSQPVITHTDCYQVEAPFELAYQRLTEDQALVFRLAAMSGSPETSVGAVAALTGMPEHQAFAVLEALADAHLVQAGVFGSYQYDPLVKLYAQRKSLAEVCGATPEVLSER